MSGAWTTWTGPRMASYSLSQPPRWEGGNTVASWPKILQNSFQKGPLKDLVVEEFGLVLALVALFLVDALEALVIIL